MNPMSVAFGRAWEHARQFAMRHPRLHGAAIALTVAAIFVVSFDLVGLLP